MSQLSDHGLRAALRTRQIVVTPLDDGHGRDGDPAAIQPASIDLRLDRHFQVLTGGTAPINPRTDTSGLFLPVTVEDGHALRLDPGECVLGATFEHITVGYRHAARVEGKSGLGRLFLLVHSTAGFIDPGFRGHITLELTNLSPRPLVLWPGMRVAQLTVQELSDRVITPYGEVGTGSHYQGQGRGPTLSLAHLGFTHGLPAEEVVPA